MANPRPKRKVRQDGKTRINLRVPVELDTFVKTYAYENKTTITALIIGFFVDLKKKTETEKVEQF